MKTIPPTCTEPEVGPKYWRSLDHLAETPEFRQWVEREFPAGASEFTDPVSRRNFVKIMSASFLLAGLGLTGCRKPEEHILPFGKQPEGYIHGVPQYYATARPTRGSAVPLLVKSYEGRPVKVEGNPNHPASNGGTDRYTQASILNLYDPDRAMRFAKGGNASTRDEVFGALTQISTQFSANGGEGLAFLLDRSSSPSRERMQRLIAKKFPKAKWFVHEAVDFNVVNEAASLASGQSVKVVYDYSKASRIVSLDCDFVGAEEDAFRHINGFSKGRKLRHGNKEMNRLYLVEGLFSLTAQNADHRLRVAPSQVAAVAAKLLAAVGGQAGEAQALAGASLTTDQKDKDGKAISVDSWIQACAKDLTESKGKCLVVAGSGQPLGVHLLALAINQQLGSVGSTLTFIEQKEAVKAGSIAELAQALNGGQVDTLVVSGVNPVYTAPAELDWAKTQAKAKTVVRLSYYEDESFAGSTWHIPAAHYLESWGDARTGEGTVVSVQPLIEPLFGGVTELEVLARVAGETKTRPYDIVRDTIKEVGGSGDFEEKWKRFLHDGFLKGNASKPVSAKVNLSAGSKALANLSASAPTKDSLEVVFHRDYSVDDGRYNNNGWLQELPDPVTKIVWENAILVNLKTAQALNIAGDLYEFNKFAPKNFENANLQVPVVKIQLNGREIEGPVWIQPGLADNVLGLALGYGREKTGRIGQGTGYNAYRLLPGNGRHFASGAKLTDTGKKHQLVVTQDHGALEGRPIIREATLDQYGKHNHFVKALDLQAPPGGMRSMYPNPLDARKDQALHQWGMVIDLTSCVGCNSCAIACQSENNVPIVGKDQVGRGREMHWLRLDRYYSGVGDDPTRDPQMVTQPMLCQHCEAAPCENVCPVNATVHDEEGLNLMVYNRCVGTRYCSNNCPYKVRRFNFFDYNKRTLKELKGPWYPTAATSKIDGEWGITKWLKEPEKGWRTGDDWDLYKMAKNPDVTVRMRGVMEKCTFCVQRIEQAKIAQKVKAGASGDVRVKESEGTLPKTACQQACPADAIVFGDISDPTSEVAKLKEEPRNYSVLEFLLTKPRLTYLAKIRNPNPLMPDAYEHPFTIQEYKVKQHMDPGQNPFEKHSPDAAHGATQGKAAPHGEAKGAH